MIRVATATALLVTMSLAVAASDAPTVKADDLPLIHLSSVTTRRHFESADATPTGSATLRFDIAIEQLESLHPVYHAVVPNSVIDDRGRELLDEETIEKKKDTPYAISVQILNARVREATTSIELDLSAVVQRPPALSISGEVRVACPVSRETHIATLTPEAMEGALTPNLTFRTSYSRSRESRTVSLTHTSDSLALPDLPLAVTLRTADGHAYTPPSRSFSGDIANSRTSYTLRFHDDLFHRNGPPETLHIEYATELRWITIPFTIHFDPDATPTQRLEIKADIATPNASEGTATHGNPERQ